MPKDVPAAKAAFQLNRLAGPRPDTRPKPVLRKPRPSTGINFGPISVDIQPRFLKDVPCGGIICFVSQDLATFYGNVFVPISYNFCLTANLHVYPFDLSPLCFQGMMVWPLNMLEARNWNRN